jgi:hypothetical protein
MLQIYYNSFDIRKPFVKKSFSASAALIQQGFQQGGVWGHF